MHQCVTIPVALLAGLLLVTVQAMPIRGQQPVGGNPDTLPAPEIIPDDFFTKGAAKPNPNLAAPAQFPPADPASGKPLAPPPAPKAPDDFELFIEGIVEAPKKPLVGKPGLPPASDKVGQPFCVT